MARFFVRLASVPFLLYAASTMGPELFGFFAFILASVEMLSSFSDFGLSRFGARTLVRHEGDRDRVAGMILVLQVLGSLALIAVALVTTFFLSPDSTRLQTVLLGLAAVLLSAFVFTTECIFTATKRFGASALLAVAGRVIYLGLGFAVMALGYSIVALMLVYVVAMAFECLLRMIYTALRVTPFSFGFSIGDLTGLVRGAVPFAVLSIAILVYFRADTLIMEAIRGDADVGIYNVAYSFFSFFVWLPVVLSRALLPGLTAAYTQDPRRAVRSGFTWYKWAGLMGIPVALVMTLLAGPVIDRLMPDAYADSAMVLRVLMWCIPFMMMNSMGLNLLTITDQDTSTAKIMVSVAAIVVALDLTLIPHWGPMGAAVAMLATTAIYGLITFVTLRGIET